MTTEIIFLHRIKVQISDTCLICSTFRDCTMHRASECDPRQGAGPACGTGFDARLLVCHSECDESRSYSLL